MSKRRTAEKVARLLKDADRDLAKGINAREAGRQWFFHLHDHREQNPVADIVALR